MQKIFFKGLTTGLLLQMAIGPVFVFIAKISLQNGATTALSAVIAVTIVDYIYIILAIMGVGKILEEEKTKRIVGFISSVILIIFGLLMIVKGISFMPKNIQVEIINSGLKQSFILAFILTISNPLTIVFWTSIFTAKMIEYSMGKKELIVFGIASGLATFLFLGLCVIILSFMKTMIPEKVIQILNILVGLLLIVYGIIRSIKTK
ncbi:LysE family translocator [Haliovirga abyssi]|uniref:Amino acid transporter n=1 Tax=Haliovirga abyssi TaxID=2996794 RepID=A0AAU9D7Z9_9FUSO|nr:LysE family transporter [Haliovirga abyssi]BDU50703.1 amino acid transporter [Haliovirga abyssi]